VLDKRRIRPAALNAALVLVPAKRGDLTELLKRAGARVAPVRGEDTATSPYAGTFESPGGMQVRIVGKSGLLIAKLGDEVWHVLPRGPGPVFHPLGDEQATFAFDSSGRRVVGLRVKEGTLESVFERLSATAAVPQPALPRDDDGPVAVVRPRNWPSFRGPHTSGVADGQQPPATWDTATGRNVRWKTPLPGLAHSSPITWGDKVFVTTAVSADPKSEFRPGLYGAGTSAKDVSRHRWQVFCVDKHSGEVLWRRTACEGVPRVKRHIKSSHSNPTPATDGKHLVVSFASEGLYCYDLDGNPLWKQALGRIDVGAFNDPDLQWGAASSPIINHDLVIVQCDRQKDSFIAAYHIDTGQRVWRTPRDEFPSWSTPTVYEAPGRPELIANGAKYIRGYDPRTGHELWRLGPNSEIPVPAPVLGQGLIFVTNGYRPIQPIYAIRPGAAGDISLQPGAESSDAVAWSKTRGGPYLPTPLVYGSYLYTCSNSGIVTCYDARSGKQIYRQRLGGSGGYSASPVAADGKLYFTAEEGDVRVVRAGPRYALLAINKMGDTCMATPAIADGMIFVRTQHYLFGIGRRAPAKGDARLVRPR
jgi:outer membrane protein assembly factor BamB